MPNPKLVIIGGSLATGKSTLAKTIEQELGIKRVSMDELKERLFDCGGYRDREWSKQIGDIAWVAFKQLVEMHLQRGDDVIAEATFLWPSDADWIHILSERHAAQVYQIWMTADPLVARQRFVERANTERHPGHCDALEHVIEEFDERFFNKSFVPLPIRAKQKIVDTTDFSAIDHDSIFDHLRD